MKITKITKHQWNEIIFSTALFSFGVIAWTVIIATSIAALFLQAYSISLQSVCSSLFGISLGSLIFFIWNSDKRIKIIKEESPSESNEEAIK